MCLRFLSYCRHEKKYFRKHEFIASQEEMLLMGSLLIALSHGTCGNQLEKLEPDCPTTMFRTVPAVRKNSPYTSAPCRCTRARKTVSLKYSIHVTDEHSGLAFQTSHQYLCDQWIGYAGAHKRTSVWVHINLSARETLIHNMLKYMGAHE